MLAIYRILSFLLMPVALFFAFLVFIALFIAISNPLLLLPLFIFACIVLYSWCSFRFLILGIDQQKSFKPSAKDWIKVNAYVAIVFATLNIFQSISFLSNPGLIEQSLEQLPNISNSSLPPETLLTVFKFTLYFMLSYCIVLAAHLGLSFYFLKRYEFLFYKQSAE